MATLVRTGLCKNHAEESHAQEQGVTVPSNSDDGQTLTAAEAVGPTGGGRSYEPRDDMAAKSGVTCGDTLPGNEYRQEERERQWETVPDQEVNADETTGARSHMLGRGWCPDEVYKDHDVALRRPPKVKNLRMTDLQQGVRREGEVAEKTDRSVQEAASKESDKEWCDTKSYFLEDFKQAAKLLKRMKKNEQALTLRRNVVDDRRLLPLKAGESDIDTGTLRKGESLRGGGRGAAWTTASKRWNRQEDRQRSSDMSLVMQLLELLNADGGDL